MSNLAKELFGDPNRKKGINSRQKGVKNERDLAKKLEEWTGQPFARIPSSGGLRWKNDTRTVGDLIPEDETFKFPFCIETKFYAKAELDISKKSRVIGAWDQASRDAYRAKKIPLLFYRINGMSKGEYIVYFRDSDISESLLLGIGSEPKYKALVEDSIGGGFENLVLGMLSREFFKLDYKMISIWVSK